MIYLRLVLTYHRVNCSISALFSLFHLVLYKKVPITEQCACVSDGLVEEKGRQLSSFTFYLFPYSTFFKNVFINSFVYFLMLYCFAFFLTRKGKYYQEMKKKTATFICKNFFFSLFQKLYRTMKVVLEKTKMQTFLVT